jgi:hypothetical protein
MIMLRCMSPDVAQSVDIGMSAFPPLLRVNRTLLGRGARV